MSGTQRGNRLGIAVRMTRQALMTMVSAAAWRSKKTEPREAISRIVSLADSPAQTIDNIQVLIQEKVGPQRIRAIGRSRCNILATTLQLRVVRRFDFSD